MDLNAEDDVPVVLSMLACLRLRTVGERREICPYETKRGEVGYEAVVIRGISDKNESKDTYDDCDQSISGYRFLLDNTKSPLRRRIMSRDLSLLCNISC